MEFFYLGNVDKIAGETSAEPVWIQAAPYGHFEPYPGVNLSLTREQADRMVDNFRNNVRGHDLELDFDHKTDRAKGNKASGWVRDMEARDDGLYYLTAWTDTARQEIMAGEWKYFSMEWTDEWVHPSTKTKYRDVALGGGLTNRPQHKGRLPINASELVLETDMSDDPKAQKPDGMEATPNQPTEPDQAVDVPKHKEPGTAPDFATPPHPADDDLTAKADVEKPQEGSVVNLDELRKKLGLSDDADEAAVMAAIDSITAEVEPLRKVAHDFDKKAKFAAEYPDEAGRLSRLDQESKERRASEFAGQFDRISETEGLSPVAKEQIEQAYMAAENGSLDAAGLTAAISAVTKKDNIVTFGEVGSSRAGETGGNTADFAEKIKGYQASDNLSYGAAVKMAAEKHPELYTAYRESIVHVGGGH